MVTRFLETMPDSIQVWLTSRKPAEEVSDQAKPPAGPEESEHHGLPPPPASLASAAQQRPGTLISTGLKKTLCCLLKGTAHRANCYGGVSNALESSKTNVHEVCFNGILTRNQTASLLRHPLLRLSARLVVLYNLVTTMQGLLPSDKDVI